MELKEIPLDKIETRHFPFSFSVGEDVSGLSRSLARVGLLNPPVVFVSPGEELYLVARGARRVRAAAAIGLEKIPVRISRETDPLDHLTANIHENAGERSLTPGEQARALRLLLDLGVEEEMVQTEYLPLVGLPPSPSWMEYLEALSRLSRKGQNAADRGLLSREMILYLSGLSAEESSRLLTISLSLGLSISHQRKVAEALQHITAHQGLTVGDVLDDPRIKKQTSRDGRREPREELVKALSAMKSPELARLEAGFRGAVSRMALPASVSLSHHPTFEKKGVTVRMIWRSPKEARFVLEKLNRADGEGLIENLLEVF
jgi:ParB family chromosome partitioning protein